MLVVIARMARTTTGPVTPLGVLGSCVDAHAFVQRCVRDRNLMPIFLIPDCISEKPVIRCTTQHDSIHAYAFLLAYAKEQEAQIRI